MAPEPAAVPSPQFHEYDAMVPSASVEVDPSTDIVRPDSVWPNAAVGGWFGAVPPPATKCCCTVLALSAEE